MTTPTAPARRGALVVGLVVTVIVAALAAVGVVRWLDEDRAPRASGPSSAPASTTVSSPESSASPAPSETATPSRERSLSGRMVRAADGWSYRVPDIPDWTSEQDVVAYADRQGRLLVQATEPSYFKAGACTELGSVARGVVGWSTPEAGTSSEEVVRNWALAVASRDDGTRWPVSKVKTSEIEHDSLTAERSSTTVLMGRSRGCLPHSMEVSATAFQSVSGTRVLVVLREMAWGGGMSAEAEQQILDTVRYERPETANG